MLRVVVVQKLDENPLIALEWAEIEDDSQAGEATRSIVEAHNERSVIQAEGALVWSQGEVEREFEFRLSRGVLAKREHPETVNLHGQYACQSGRKFQYYGKAVSFTSYQRSFWEVYLYAYGKEFKYDGIFNSPDLLITLRGPLVDIEIGGREALRRLGRQAAEEAIENWDNGDC